jgi:phage host-nuclease inhibitor protein Gam
MEEANMSLIDELKTRKAELLRQAEAIDREAAMVRERYEEKLADLRKERIPLEERIRTIDILIRSEGGE